MLPKQEKKKKEAFTREELEKIGKAVNKVDYADMIYTLCYTGFRISEFLELKRDSYDSKKFTLTGGKKTDAGKDRVVPIHPKIRGIVAKYALMNGDTLFCRSDGKAFTADNFRKDYYYAALERIGARILTPHSTRHTFLTLLSDAGARTEDIQALAGHEDFEMTATYIHPDIITLQRTINLLK